MCLLQHGGVVELQTNEQKRRKGRTEISEYQYLSVGNSNSLQKSCLWCVINVDALICPHLDALLLDVELHQAAVDQLVVTEGLKWTGDTRERSDR